MLPGATSSLCMAKPFLLGGLYSDRCMRFIMRFAQPPPWLKAAGWRWDYLLATGFVPASQLDIELFAICRPRRMEIFPNPPRPASSSAVWQQACGGNFSAWLLAMWEFAQYSLETNLHPFDVCQWCGANQIVFVFASCEQQWGDGYLHWDTRNYGLFPLQDLWMYAIYSCQEGKRVTKRLRLSTNFASFHPRVHLENGSLRWRVQSFAGSVKIRRYLQRWN